MAKKELPKLKLADITPKDLLALADAEFEDKISTRVQAVDALLKGKIRWSPAEEQFEDVMVWLYKNKSRTYPYLYEIPYDDIWQVIQSKVKLPRVKELEL